MLILGIESSCDDTAAAVIDEHFQVKSSVISSQDDIHAPFGGVVPELASRKHLENIEPIVGRALSQAGVKLKDIDLIAVTQGPGLIGSLLVGFSFAKALAFFSDIPLIGVDHMAGHILSVFLEPIPPPYPYVALIASGGTSSIFLVEGPTEFHHLGRTRDDAAGEAFDKIAKLLQLPYPGGPQVAGQAMAGDDSRISFPRAWLEEGSLDFSFSGLKTAVLNHCRQQEQRREPLAVADICACFQRAVIDVLVQKTLAAAARHGVSTIVVGGGVSANRRLRETFQSSCERVGYQFFVPRPQYCTDNAAMIALAGYHSFQRLGATPHSADVYSRSQLG